MIPLISDFSSTCVKDLVFREARAPSVLCIDSHVLLAPGALKRLISFFEDNPHCNDLLHGPLYRNITTGSWHPVNSAFEPAHRPTLGTKIPSNGSCSKRRTIRNRYPDQRALCLPEGRVARVFHRLTGYGEEEFYTRNSEQSGNMAGSACHSCAAIQVFRAAPEKYDLSDVMAGSPAQHLDRTWELGLDPEPVKDWFGEVLGSPAFEDTIAEIEAEMNSPFFVFEVPITSMPSMWGRIGMGFGIGSRRWEFFVLGALPTSTPPTPPAAARLLGHRAVVEFARYAQFESVIMSTAFDGLPEGTLEAVASSVERIRQADWGLWALV